MGKPYKCPVCEGRGTVPAGFYNQSRYMYTYEPDVTCKSCFGRGIVYGTDNWY